MTKKDYEMIANVLVKHDTLAIPKGQLIEELSAVFEADNQKFDAYKFGEACYHVGTTKTETEG